MAARRAQTGLPQRVVAPAVASPMVASPTAGSEASRRLVAEFDVLRRQLPRRCQALTKAGRQCKNRARPPSVFCQVHAEWAPSQDPLEAFPHTALLAGYVLDQMLEAGVLTLAQLAVLRIGIVVGSGLCTWVFYELLMRVESGWQSQPLAAWSLASLAFGLTCWLLGRLVGGSGFVAGLRILLFLLLSLLSPPRRAAPHSVLCPAPRGAARGAAVSVWALRVVGLAALSRRRGPRNAFLQAGLSGAIAGKFTVGRSWTVFVSHDASDAIAITPRGLGRVPGPCG
jgi:hypothetical protein